MTGNKSLIFSQINRVKVLIEFTENLNELIMQNYDNSSV